MKLLIAIVPLVTTLAGPSAKPEARSARVEVWVRGDGAPGPNARAHKTRATKVVVPAGGERLAALVAQAKPTERLDLALLHFANGMAVPVPFRDESVMKRLEPTVTPKENGARVAVKERWHPEVPVRAQKDVSPWEHADQLVGIELVESGPYYRQFQVDGDDDVVRGFALFKESCQFCHGARNVGAKFGWDFVEPYPIYKFRRPAKHLYNHVAYKPYDAAQKGLLMPALKYMSIEDATSLWKWLEALATKPMPPYATVAFGR